MAPVKVRIEIVCISIEIISEKFGYYILESLYLTIIFRLYPSLYFKILIVF